MKDEFLVTLLTSSGEKQCLQRFKNVVMCFNRVLREYDTVVRTQCWNLKGSIAKNNADDVRESLDNSDLVICVIDPTATEGVRDDIVQALDWVRESFQMAFFAVKERNMFIYVREASNSNSGAGSKQAQRAVSFLETLYKKNYNPITYPSENAFALTLLYQLCNMVRSELWCCDFQKDKGFGLVDIFSSDGIREFGINFRDLPWVKNFNKYRELVNEIESLRRSLSSGVNTKPANASDENADAQGADQGHSNPESKCQGNKYLQALRIAQQEHLKSRMEQPMLKAYCLLCRFFCRQNTPEMSQAISAFLAGDLVQANKKLNIPQLVKRISAYRKNPAGLKSAGGTYKMEFDYLLNCYLLKIALLQLMEPLNLTDTEEELYNNVLSLSQGLVTLVEQMGINDEAGDVFFCRDKITKAKAQFESSVKMYEAFPKEKQRKTAILAASAYHLTARCLEEELGEVKVVEGENLPRKTISALKAIRINYQKSLSIINPLLKRYPNSYWPIFTCVYRDFYDFYIKTGQIIRADKLSEETHLMVSRLDVQGQSAQEKVTEDNQWDTKTQNPANKNINKSKTEHRHYDFVKLLDKWECQVDIKHGLLDRAQRRIPKGLSSYIKSLSKEPNKVEKDLFSWIDSEETLPDILSILKWGRADNGNSLGTPLTKEKESNLKNAGNPERTIKEESDPLETNPYENWDIAQILTFQATIYLKKEDFIQAIRYAAAAIESINKRLVNNPSLAPLLTDPLRILEEGFYATKNLTEGLECTLHAFNLMQPSIQLKPVSYLEEIKRQIFTFPMLLAEVPEDKGRLISHDLVTVLKNFIIENYSETYTKRVFWFLKGFKIHYQKYGLTQEVAKTEEDICKIEALMEKQRKENVQYGGLFGDHSE